ncbi:type II secretion system protein N [Pulveribacter suum]|uniref:General secretion pathway protein C n=1 Tax=Pulveribacter suum TaxID=2116657 RepID=A0A2P1NP25_9BURK|nr:type II secretion system protein N [Pulveribacter suum]AVP58763.1 general secretion pathway protein C [Pulveribacter suum]
MVTHTLRAPGGGSWAPRLTTLALWAAAGAAALYWALALSAQPAGPVPATLPAAPQADAQAVARLLGAGVHVAAVQQSAAPAAPGRFVLQGVLAGTTSGHGAALVSVDGQPPKPVRVGASVEPGLVLQSLSRREARLGPSLDGATTVTLQMPLGGRP